MIQSINLNNFELIFIVEALNSELLLFIYNLFQL